MTSNEKRETPPDSALERYRDAARDGRLLLKRCRSCGEPQDYPRPICPFCMSDDTEWLEASGHGEIYSWSVQRRADPPYAIAYVTLSEGPTMLTAIVDCDLECHRDRPERDAPLRGT